MFPNHPYTPAAREVLKLSREEAERFRHNYIGPEHYLLSILRKGDGIAIQVMVNKEVDLSELKSRLEGKIVIGSWDVSERCLIAPNSDGKRILKTAHDESLAMRHGWVGTEHFLLAISKELNTVPYECLNDFGLSYEIIRNEVIQIIDGPVVRNKYIHKKADELTQDITKLRGNSRLLRLIYQKKFIRGRETKELVGDKIGVGAEEIDDISEAIRVILKDDSKRDKFLYTIDAYQGLDDKDFER